MNEQLDEKQLEPVGKALPPLPNEIFCQILGFFSEEEFVKILVVNKYWNRFIQESFTKEVIFFQKAFAKSTLWNYLSTISSGGSLEAYFKSFLPHIWVERVIPFDDITGGVKNFGNRGFRTVGVYQDNLLQRKGVCAPTLMDEAEQLKKKLNGKRILDCLASTDLSQVRKVYLARQYRDVESVFTLLMLAIQISHTPQYDDWGQVIFYSHLNRWINGAGLHVLENCCRSVSIFEGLIHHAIALKKITNRDAIQEEQLIIIEDLLSRLTDNDWHSFLLEGSYAHDLLIEAIGEDFLPIVTHIGPWAFDKLIENSSTPKRLEFLLEHMGAERVSLLLPTLYEKFTGIVSSDDYAQLISQLFASLTEIQFYEMVKKLNSNQFDCLINSSIFLYFLVRLDLLFPKARKYKVDAHTLRPNQILIGVEKIPIKMTCSSSRLLVGLAKLRSYHPKMILASKAAKYLTVGHRDFLRQLYSVNSFLLQEKLWEMFHKGYFEPREESSDKANSPKAPKKNNMPAKRSLGEKNTIPVSSNQNPPFSDAPHVRAAFAALPANQQNAKSPVEQKKTDIDLSDNHQQSQRVVQRPSPAPNSIHPRDYAILKAIGLSVIKGFFIGLLVTGIAILLMMFINYQMDIQLLEIINNLWIAGVAGVFAEIVATACYLAETKVFESSNSGSTNQKADDPKPFDVPPVQGAPTANPAHDSKPFFSDVETAATTKPPVQQTFAQTPVDSQNGIFKFCVKWI